MTDEAALEELLDLPVDVVPVLGERVSLLVVHHEPPLVFWAIGPRLVLAEVGEA